MQNSLQRILTGTIFFVIALIVGASGYVLFGWSLSDAIYMVVITVFGVGYGEVRPLDTTAERVFTIGVIFAGTSSAVYVVGGFIQMVTEGEIERALDSRRRDREIENLSEHIIICGFGRIGQILARQLTEASQAVVIVEIDPERIQRAVARGYAIVEGSAADEAILAAAGIARAKTLVTVLSDDALNVFITLTARELNPDLIILARGELPSTEKKLRLAGADRVVLPAETSALRLSNLITRPIALEFLAAKDERQHLEALLAEMDIQISELPVPANSPLVGLTINKLELHGNGSFIIVAIRRHDGTTLTHPHYSLVLQAGDTAIVMGHRGDIPRFARRSTQRRQMRYRGARL
ncbi:MAG: potassium channel protein [Spirulinaceae cyanobacterium SM2_1_0]|nr:potassium channel protein [Spirulinaceae cyanobacterium SM2_1_0]